MEEELKKLRNENHNIKEQLENYIPRRRVRRVYKMLGDILEADTDVSPHIQTLKDFINKCKYYRIQFYLKSNCGIMLLRKRLRKFF